jgi:hypothetical protein
MEKKSSFEPGVAERYLDSEQLADRWKCNARTVSGRARKLGIQILLLGGSLRYPISQVMRIEQAAVAQYESRQTEFPPQLAKAKRGKRGPYKIRLQGRAIDAGAIAQN